MRYAGLASLFTGAQKEKFPLGLYRNPPTFFFTNPRFVLLTRDQHFVLLTSYIIRPERLLRTTVSRSEKKSIYNILNMEIFLTKIHPT